MIHIVTAASILLAPHLVGAEGPPTADSRSPAQLVAEGRRMLKAESYESAKELFSLAIKANPKHAVAYNELGTTLFQQGAIEASVNAFKQAVKLAPRLSHAWANLGESERRVGNFRRGAVAFHHFLNQKTRSDAYGLYGMGLCFEGYGALEKAQKTLSIAERHARKKPRLLSRIRQSLRRVAVKMKQARLPLIERADAMLRAGHWEEALALYNEGLAKEPTSAVFLARKGLLLAIMGQTAKAKTALEAALISNAKEPVARVSYLMLTMDAEGQVETGPRQAAVFLDADRAAMAHKAFSKGLVEEPDNPIFRLGRAEALLRLGRLDEAVDDFQKSSNTTRGAAGEAEVQLLKGNEETGMEALIKSNANVPLLDLPVWRRSLLMD